MPEALARPKLGQVAATVPKPSLPGVSPGNAVTNAVTYQKNLIIHANGGAGVWVTEADLDKRKSGQTPTVVQLGRLQFPVPVSTNFVVARGDLLFVAAGTGGLKIVDLAAS